MYHTLRERFRQGHRTMGFPDGPPPAMPELFRGVPRIQGDRCAADCRSCLDLCPTGALEREGGTLRMDLGKCLFCGDCANACPTKAITFTRDHHLASRTRANLVTGAGTEQEKVKALDEAMRGLFGRSLQLRQVSAGGCNACEADVNVLSTPFWDLGRFGVRMVASPRHADGLLVTGCVTENMRVALEKAYAAVAPPKIVIAVGACAISGGPYWESAEQHGGVASLLPVDLYIPGCPPHPLTILDGLLGLLGRLEKGRVNEP